MAWPISMDDIGAARGRIAPYLPETPVRQYGVLDSAIGEGIQVLVKHENFQRGARARRVRHNRERTDSECYHDRCRRKHRHRESARLRLDNY